MVKETKKSGKGELFKDHKDFIHIDDKEEWKNIPGKKDEGGIYALYNNYGLYYVGLTNRSLRNRIHKHKTKNHKNKWNRYSWYQTKNIEYAKDIETIILNLTNPPGNKVKGRVVSGKSKEKLDIK